ncbi:helix-turn-helix domain-containing protein, partial [Deltaproteobacteria bacterium TL4]
MNAPPEGFEPKREGLAPGIFTRKLKNQKFSQQIHKAIERAKAVLSFYKGLTADVIATAFSMSERSINRWIKKFSTFGVDSLYDEERGGRPTKLSKVQEEELKQIVVEQNGRVWT